MDLSSPRTRQKIIILQRTIITVLLIIILIAVLRIWKYAGKGSMEWHNEYTLVKWENDRIRRCIMEYEQEPFWLRQEGIRRYCKL